MSENKLLDLSFEFAVAVVTLVDSITMPKSAYMIDQLARSGTSVGANIHEAQYAQSKKDFVAKLEFALKKPEVTHFTMHHLFFFYIFASIQFHLFSIKLRMYFT